MHNRVFPDLHAKILPQAWKTSAMRLLHPFPLRFRTFDARLQMHPRFFSGGVMEQTIERRSSRRFTMALPLTIRSGQSAEQEGHGRTRDVSFRGLYFVTDAGYETGARIEFVLTLPKEVTQVGDVNIRCFAEVVRVETEQKNAQDGSRGIAARIERYEFLPGPV
jgi:hypothetical protein